MKRVFMAVVMCLWAFSVMALPEGAVAILEGHSDEVNSVAFSPNGQLLASGSNDNTIKLWDVANRREVATLEKADWVMSVAFSPDGKMLASGMLEAGITLWDMASKKQLDFIGGWGMSVYSLAFSPNGKMLASTSYDYTIDLWDVEKENHYVATLKGHTGQVYSVAFSPDGKLLVSGSQDKTIKLWDVESKKEVATLEKADWVMSVAFSPDGKLLASGGYGKLKLWDVESKKKVTTLEGYGWYVAIVAFSPDGDLLAGGIWDNTIKLWDVESKKEVATLWGHTNSINSVAFSPNGRLLASGSSDGTILLWDMMPYIQGPITAVTPIEKQTVTWGKVKETELFQNYPNPFNPDTWIPYQLKEESDVTISIYDIAGRLVRRLDLGHKQAGMYVTKDRAAYWDGRNEAGEMVSSGVYILVFKARDYENSQRIVLIR